MNDLELRVWTSFVDVLKIFLVIYQVGVYKELVKIAVEKITGYGRLYEY